MPFESSDLRSTLPTTKEVVPETFSGAEHVQFRDLAPVEKGDGVSTWYARGQNFVVGYSDVDGSASWARQDQPDEYVVLLADDGLSAVASSGGADVSVSGRTMLVLPPGDSTVTVTGQGRVIRLLTTRSGDVAGLAANAASYDEHQLVHAPAVTVIPPPSLHTSEAVAPDRNHLIDVFSPPRSDFSAMEGWVFNADEYPAP
jgi:hypothetical protein